MTYNLEVGGIPPSHTPVGYIAYLKVLDEEDHLYYARRSDGLNDMEMLGMAQAMRDGFSLVLADGTVELDEGE